MFGRSVLMDQTVQHIARHYEQDDRGNERWVENPPVEVEHCSVQPLDSVEYLTAAADQTVSRWQFFGPPGMGLAHTDLIEADGTKYEVDGKASVARSVSAFLTHTTAILKEYTG